jgi:hypothetical protein
MANIDDAYRAALDHAGRQHIAQALRTAHQPGDLADLLRYVPECPALARAAGALEELQRAFAAMQAAAHALADHLET